MVWLGKDTDVAQGVIIFGIQGVVDRSTTEGVRRMDFHVPTENGPRRRVRIRLLTGYGRPNSHGVRRSQKGRGVWCGRLTSNTRQIRAAESQGQQAR
jgi:hypothetical protein